MTAEQITTIISNICTTGGVAVFVFLLVRGLRSEIGALKGTVEAQRQTLEVMRTQVAEAEKIGDMYKKLTTDFPEMLEQYQKGVKITKDKVIEDLKADNQMKDEKLKKSKELELRQLELAEQLIAELPELQKDLVANIKAIEERFGAMEQVLPPMSRTRLPLAQVMRRSSPDPLANDLLRRFQPPAGFRFSEQHDMLQEYFGDNPDAPNHT